MLTEAACQSGRESETALRMEFTLNFVCTRLTPDTRTYFLFTVFGVATAHSSQSTAH